MLLYANNGGKLKVVKEIPFKLEKDLQQLVEQNLATLMNLILIKSEFILKDKRFDTLAYDPESKSFVIIEYKRDKNISVIDQGFTYLNLLLDNPAECILSAQQTLKHTITKANIDWSQTRVVFIASSFNDFQKQATNFKDLGIELWEIKQFENGQILVSPIKRSKNAPSIKTTNTTTNIPNPIKTYTEEQHISIGLPEIQELYTKFKNSLYAMDDDIDMQPKAQYIAFKKASNVTDVEIQKKQLKIHINAKWGTLDDPKHLFEDMSHKGKFGNGDYQVAIANDKNLEYIMSVIKQVL
ncbi:MAG: DUF5655 domain-containing protein [Muribaculaceae bacterium]|nr:DUF5655 domain-containing protein [Muribaculaceae bacterium]